jgi:hypothetical protein
LAIWTISDLAIYNALARRHLDHNLKGRVMKPRIVSTIVTIILAAVLMSACKEGGEKTPKKVILPAGEVHEGWYFAAGDEVLLEGTVNGDVYAAGGLVEIDGTINGDLIVAGGQVTVGGTVSDDVRAAGGTVRISGKVGKNVTVAGGSVIIARGSSIGKNLLAAGGSLQINGSVGEDARLGAGDVDVTGSIKGNIKAGIDHMTIHRGALVGGNLDVYTRSSEDVTVDSGTVAGTVTFEAREPEHRVHILGMSAGRFWFKLWFFLSLIVTTLVLAFLLPAKLLKFGEAVHHKSGWSAIWGIVALLVIPVVAAILICTLVGAPIGFLLLTVYVWGLYFSQLSIGLLIARLVFRRTEGKGWKLFGPVGLGLLCVFLLGFVPYLNVLLVIAGLILGTGALFMMAGEAWKTHRATPMVAQSGISAS